MHKLLHQEDQWSLLGDTEIINFTARLSLAISAGTNIHLEMARIQLLHILAFKQLLMISNATILLAKLLILPGKEILINKRV